MIAAYFKGKALALAYYLRRAAHMAQQSIIFFRPDVWRLAFSVLRNEGMDGILRRLRHYYGDPTAGQCGYREWYRRYARLSEEDRRQIREHLQTLRERPKISVLMPVYNTDPRFLTEAIASVRRQLYEHWELCIVDDASTVPHVRTILESQAAEEPRIRLHFRAENGHIAAATNDALRMATGDFAAFMDHDDLLAEHALYCVVERLNRYPDAEILYSDEDKIDEEGKHLSAHFKPDWNRLLFLSYNYLCHLLVCRMALARAVGFDDAHNGCQDYAFLLEATRRVPAAKIHHIPLILYHWRECEGSTALSMEFKPYAVENSLRALSRYTEALGLETDVTAHPRLTGAYRIRWPLPEDNPVVTLVIPSRNKHELVRRCVESIRKTAGYEHYDILLVDNQSDDPASIAFFREAAKEPGVRVFAFDEPFNYARLNNEAVKQVTTPYVCFVNNDIVFTSEGWLAEMLSYFSLEDTGAVGCKLYYGNGRIQHFGVLLRGGYLGEAVAGNIFCRFPGDSLGYMGRAVLAQEFSAVTAACLLTRTDIFREVGGFNEERLAIAFNDVDLCLKIGRAEYKIVATPYAEAVHAESASRGYEDTPEKRARFMRETAAMHEFWGDALKRDPHYNPNLTPYAMDFKLAWPPEVEKPWQWVQREKKAM